MSHDLPISIRPLTAGDHDLVYNSWITSLGRCHPYRDLDPGWFTAAQHALIARLLERGGLAAVEPDDSDQIYGYLVGEPERRALHWIYTKHPFRQAHVATRLLREAFGGGDEPIAITVQTPAIRHHIERWHLEPRSALLRAKARL